MDIKRLLGLCVVMCALLSVGGCIPETQVAETDPGADASGNGEDNEAADGGADASEDDQNDEDAGPGPGEDAGKIDAGEGMNTGDTGGTQRPDGTSCADGESDCDGQCVDTDSSTEHCGKCGSPCEALGEHTRVGCALGECIRGCEDGWTDEDGDWTDVEDPSGTNGCETECSPTNGGTEVCDGKDNDCDGDVDEGLGSTYYRDADDDGSGDPMATRKACSKPDGFVDNAEDCDDTRAAVHPGAQEVCDGKIDHNCDNQVDEGCPCTNGDSKPCGTNTGVCTEGTKTCKMGQWSKCSGQMGGKETCDGKDNDCDGQKDEGVQKTTYYFDRDRDGYGYNKPLSACKDPGADWSTKKGDCDDSDPSINPGASEACDGADNDCDGKNDEGLYLRCSRSECKLCTRIGNRCRKQTACKKGSWQDCCY